MTGTGFSPEGAVEREGGGARGPAAEKLLAIGALGTNARLVEADEAWRVRGSPTEGALLVVARKAGLDPETLAQASPRVAEVSSPATARTWPPCTARETGPWPW